MNESHVVEPQQPEAPEISSTRNTKLVTHEIEDNEFTRPNRAAARSTNFSAFQRNGNLSPSPINTTIPPTFVTHQASPVNVDLRVKTDLWPATSHHGPSPLGHRSMLSQEMENRNSLPVRSSSVKSLTAHFAGGSPGSAFSSPNLPPLTDITPLPSPVDRRRSPVPWPRPRVSIESDRSDTPELSKLSNSPPKKRRPFPEKIQVAKDPNLAAPVSHARNRSFSEYVATPGQVARNRNIAVSGVHTPTMKEQTPQPMHREEYLAPQRGISALPTPRPPTPPASNKSVISDSGSPPSFLDAKISSERIFEAPMLKSGKTRQWVAVRLLGTGSFSRVILGTSDLSQVGTSEEELDPKTLVAVKVCEHGPAGGADEKRIEESLKREIEILKAINHPSLIHLKAVNILEKRAYLVLTYCPGGDMFELASNHHKLFTPSLIRRIFAELVAAVRYLHDKLIVHRDIKLENVLLNLRLTADIAQNTDWQTYPHSVVVLSDLGLGRFLPSPPASQLLSTQCGSEDYAAPELLMGQDYDGRMTDAWALGVLLYAVMEGRLPFDPIPGARRQSPPSHRIARCEWEWVKYADSDGNFDDMKYPDLVGAKDVAEGLLTRSRSRFTLEKVSQMEWVKEGIMVEGGLSVPEMH